MLTVLGATGVDISPAELLLKDMPALLMDTYRLSTLCTYLVLIAITIYRHVGSWKLCMACLQICHH